MSPIKGKTEFGYSNSHIIIIGLLSKIWSQALELREFWAEQCSLSFNFIGFFDFKTNTGIVHFIIQSTVEI